MIEEFHFWSAEKTKFWIGVMVVALIVALVAFAIYALSLYQQKTADSKMDSKAQSAPAATPFDTQNGGASNATSPLSPVPDTTNLN